MAKGPGPALLLAGVAALFLLKGKKGNGANGASDETKSDDPGGDKEKPDNEVPAAPKAKTQEELEEEFDPDPDPEADAAEADTTDAQIVAQAQWKKWPTGSELSSAAGQREHNVIFASEDCEAALMGRDWNPVIEFEDKLYDPASFWKAFAEGVRPNQVVEEIGSSNVRWFADRLLKNQNAVIACEVKVPYSGDYDTPLAYDNAWTAFLNSAPAFSDLYQLIYHLRVKAPMMAAWAEEDPDAYLEYQLHEMAEWAVDKYPNEDVTEQTDQAYFSWIEGYDDAPAVLDPSNPAHQDFIDLWVQLNEMIKSL